MRLLSIRHLPSIKLQLISLVLGVGSGIIVSDKVAHRRESATNQNDPGGEVTDTGQPKPLSPFAGVAGLERFAEIDSLSFDALVDYWDTEVPLIARSSERELVKNYILKRWAQLDPKRALSILNQNATDQEMGAFFFEWAAHDMRSAWDAAQRHGMMAASSVVLATGMQNPKACLAILEENPEPSQLLDKLGRFHTQALFERLATVNIETATSLAMKLRHSKYGALRGLGRGIAKVSPVTAVEWAESLGDPVGTTIGLSQIMGVFGQEDPDLAGAVLAKIQHSRYASVQAVRGMLTELAQSSGTEAVIGWLNEHGEGKPEFVKRAAAGPLLRALKRNPKEAFVLAAQLPDGFQPAKEWRPGYYYDDPETVLRAAVPHFGEPFARGVVSGITAWLLEGDLSYASEVIGSLPEGELRRHLAAQLASEVEARERIDPGFKRLVKRDLGAAIRALPDIETEDRKHAVATVAAAWAELDPKETMDWIRTLDASEDTLAALSTAVPLWSKSDLFEMSAYLATLENGRLKDQAINLFVREAAGPAPDAALEWAMSVGAAHLRSASIEEVVSRWARQNYAAASEAIAEMPLPDERRQHLFHVARTSASSGITDQE